MAGNELKKAENGNGRTARNGAEHLAASLKCNVASSTHHRPAAHGMTKQLSLVILCP